MFTIKVEDRHIRESQQRLKLLDPNFEFAGEYGCNCPIALAAQEKFPLQCIQITPTAMVFHHGKIPIEYWTLPELAQDFVDRFDNGTQPVYPFTFQIGGI